MSFEDGMAAMRLEFSDRVPRTEYSAESHWELVARVTGIPVTWQSPDSEKGRASNAFKRAWNYDMIWNVLVHRNYMHGKTTSMGHAVYAAGGTDYDDHVGAAFDDPEEVLKLDPMELYGPLDRGRMTREFNEHYRGSVRYFPDAVNMTGVYITCISGLIEMLGWDMLLTALGTDPEAFGELTNRYCRWIGLFFEALADCEAEVVMVHDDIVWTEGPFAHPAWYRKYVFPNYKKLFAPLREAGKKILYTSDGTYTAFVDDIADCGVLGFVMEPTTDMALIAERYGKDHVFVGNADTRILLNGTREEIYREVKRCMDIGKRYPGFIMAVGNHIPANTPVENALWYNECYEKMSRR